MEITCSWHQTLLLLFPSPCELPVPASARQQRPCGVEIWQILLPLIYSCLENLPVPSTFVLQQRAPSCFCLHNFVCPSPFTLLKTFDILALGHLLKARLVSTSTAALCYIPSVSIPLNFSFSLHCSSTTNSFLCLIFLLFIKIIPGNHLLSPLLCNVKITRPCIPWEGREAGGGRLFSHRVMDVVWNKYVFAEGLCTPHKERSSG